METNGIKEITAKELKADLIDHKGKFTLVDVREPHEYQIAKIPGAKLIPLGEVPQRARELDTADDIVVHCRSVRAQRQGDRRLAEDGLQTSS